MKRLGAHLAIPLLLLMVPGTALAISKSKTPKCSLPSNATMVSANYEALMYTLPERDGPHGTTFWPEVFACTFRYKHTYDLGETTHGGDEGVTGIRLETLSGLFVAYEGGYSASEGPGSPQHTEWSVVVRNIRTGQIVHDVPSGPSRFPGDVGVGPVTSLIVKSDGAVAWMADGSHLYKTKPEKTSKSTNTQSLHSTRQARDNSQQAPT